MAEIASSSEEPVNIFEMFPRSLGFVGLVPSWLLFYFYVITPWDEAKKQLTHVVYSITAIGITVGVTMGVLVLLIGGVRGSRYLADFAPAKFGWKQGIFVLVSRNLRAPVHAAATSQALRLPGMSRVQSP